MMIVFNLDVNANNSIMIKNFTKKQQIHILANNYIGDLAYIYRNRPFIAPITYFHDKRTNTLIGYSNEGHKIKGMRQNTNVSVCVTEVDSVNNWDSVLVHGSYVELSGIDAKAYLHTFAIGVKDLIIKKEHRKLDFISQFSSKIFKDEIPIVFQIKIDEITGKMRRA